MADDASEWPALLRKTISCFTHAYIFSIECFKCKTELFSYLILCVAKMPFIPPALSTGRPRSACGPGLTAEDTQTKCLSLPVTALNKTKASADDKCSSVKERLALNLRHLGRKSKPRAHLPTAKVVAAPGLHVKSRDQWLPSSKVLSGVSHAPSRSGESATSKIPLYSSHVHHNASSVKSGPQVSSSGGSVPQEEASFTLTLTPEAVQLLQRRSDERIQRSAAKMWRARDDVEYDEEEGDGGVDEHVLLKCMEWLRGLENAPVTMGNGTSDGTASLKSF